MVVFFLWPDNLIGFIQSRLSSEWLIKIANLFSSEDFEKWATFWEQLKFSTFLNYQLIILFNYNVI